MNSFYPYVEKKVYTFDAKKKRKIEVILTFNKASLDNIIYWQNIYGQDFLERIHSGKYDLKDLLKILYAQLTVESKKLVLAIKTIDLDQDGNEFEINKEPYQKLSTFFGVGDKSIKDLMDIFLKVQDAPNPNKIPINLPNTKKKMKMKK